MPESQFLKKIIGAPDDSPKSFTSERQLTAQAFNLHVERRDGRSAEGFAWSHYAGYQWSDEGEREKLIVLFGNRALEIEGHNLKVLLDEIREGQLNSITEMVSAQAELKRANAEREPIISSVRMYPDFGEIIKEIKGDGEHDTGFTGKIRGR